MAIAKYTAQLSEKISLGTNFLFLQIELLEPHRLEFVAGQYVLLEIPASPKKRAYSIASAPRMDHAIQLLIEVVPGGQASSYITDLKIGEQISFYAPAGGFTVSPEVQATMDPLVFVATGSGLSPLRSMILDQLRTRESTRPIKLYWGMREAADLFWLDYFEELRKNYPNFSYEITLSRPPENWTLARGRVTNSLSVNELLPNAHYYLCGNPNMIADASKVLSDRGVDSAHLHFEKFN